MASSTTRPSAATVMTVAPTARSTSGSRMSGGSGIRTHGAHHPGVFKTPPFGRSGIPPGRTLPAALLAGFDAVEAGERAQHFGDDEGAAVVLVVLEEEHQHAADRDCGAVQRVHQTVAVDAAHARVQAARGEVEVVRARVRLAVAALRREPPLDVVLLRRRRAEVARRD